MQHRTSFLSDNPIPFPLRRPLPKYLLGQGPKIELSSGNGRDNLTSPRMYVHPRRNGLIHVTEWSSYVMHYEMEGRLANTPVCNLPKVL